MPEDEAEDALRNGLNIRYGIGAETLARKFLRQSLAVANRAFNENKFRKGNKWCRVRFPQNRGLAERTRQYVQSLLGQKLNSRRLLGAADDVIVYFGDHDDPLDSQMQAYWLGAVRMVMIAGDPARALELLDAAPNLRWHQKEADLLRRVCESSIERMPIKDKKLLAVFDQFFVGSITDQDIITGDPLNQSTGERLLNGGLGVLSVAGGIGTVGRIAAPLFRGLGGLRVPTGVGLRPHVWSRAVRVGKDTLGLEPAFAMSLPTVTNTARLGTLTGRLLGPNGLNQLAVFSTIAGGAGNVGRAAVDELLESGAISETTRYRAGVTRTPRHHWLLQRDVGFFNERGFNGCWICIVTPVQLQRDSIKRSRVLSAHLADTAQRCSGTSSTERFSMVVCLLGAMPPPR